MHAIGGWCPGLDDQSTLGLGDSPLHRMRWERAVMLSSRGQRCLWSWQSRVNAGKVPRAGRDSQVCGYRGSISCSVALARSGGDGRLGHLGLSLGISQQQMAQRRCGEPALCRPSTPLLIVTGSGHLGSAVPTVAVTTHHCHFLSPCFLHSVMSPTRAGLWAWA